MARPRSQKISQIKLRLISRLRDGLHRPGDRFMSNRAVARQFNISYQTAHRLIAELCREGLLIRRAASGTYLPGPRPAPAAALLIFDRRARRPDSFGQRLLERLVDQLERQKIPSKIRWSADVDRSMQIPDACFPVIWECPTALAACIAQRRSALLLNDRPPSGIASVFIDSVSTDDFSGGACAAQLLTRRGATKSHLAILAGPDGDKRSDARVAGFLSVHPATVIHSPTWFFEGGLSVVARAAARGSGGLFCCNDRLAEAVHVWFERCRRSVPPLVGFDDAPVAEKLNLTTMAIPWDELVAGAVGVIRRRLSQDSATSSRQIFAPRPVMRNL